MRRLLKSVAARGLSFGIAACALGALPLHAHDEHAQQRAQATSASQRSLHVYRLPDVTLLDMNGARVPLAAALRDDGPVLLNFIFTTCTSVCPVMSATFAETQRQLLAQGFRVRMVSISIDPEHDTPERLRAFARKHGAAPGWQFLTGSAGDIVNVQRALDAYRGNKMSHAPAAFFRASASDRWTRFDGLTSATELVAEVKRAADK